MFLTLLLPANSYATSGKISDQSSCTTMGGIWDSLNSTCIVNGLTIGSAETLTIATGITLKNNGTINNYGTINNTGVIVNLDVINNNYPSGVLSNSGIIDDVGGIINDFPGSSFINNVNSTIYITDRIGIYGELGGEIHNQSGGIVSNFGVIITTIKGVISNDHSTFNNSGKIDNSGFFFNTGVVHNFGIIVNNYGAKLQSVGLVNSGTIDNLGDFHNFGEFVNNLGGIVNDSSTGTITNEQFSTITNFGTISNSGTISGYGEVDNGSTGTISNSGAIDIGPILNNSGMLDNFGTISNSRTIFNNSPTGTISNSGTISNLGTIYNHSIIDNQCGAVYSGKPLVGNPINNTCIVTTTTSVISSLNPSMFRQLVTFTATVSPNTATGNVTFVIDGVSKSTDNLSGGQATFSLSALTVGSHIINVLYSGDKNDAISTGNLTQMVNKIPTTTILSSSSNSSIFGQTVTFTAKISPKNITGNVRFVIDGSFQTSIKLLDDTAVLSVSSLSVGQHKVTALYSGDNIFMPSNSSPISVTIETPAQATQDLINVINQMNLPHNLTQKLDTKLKEVVNYLNSDNNKLAIKQLNTFINEINAQTDKKITQDQTKQLITAAQNIINSIS